MTSPGIIYRPYRAGDELAIIELCNRVFATRWNLPRWRWEFADNPIARMDVSLAFSGTTLAGHCAGVPMRMVHDNSALRATRIQNAFVHPSMQRRGIFSRLLDELKTRLRTSEVDHVFSFPNDRSLPVFLKTGVYVHVCDVYTYELEIGRVAPDTSVRGEVEVVDAPAFTPRDAAFVGRELARCRIHNPRDLDYLRWRYHPGSDRRYRIVRVFDGGEQVGLAVAKAYRAGRAIDVVELVFRADEALLRAGLRAASRCFSAERPRVLTSWSMSHYPLHDLLLRMGFKRQDRPTHLISHALTSRASRDCDEPSAYYVTMGDSDVY